MVSHFTVDLRVLELISSRLCHELIGPITGISTGIELASGGENGADREILELLGFSAAQASARLQFYRLAYGLGGSDDESVTLGQITRLCDGIVGETRVTCDWSAVGSLDARMRKSDARLFLNLFVIACDSLPKGGTVSARPSEQGARIVLEAAGEGAGLAEVVPAAFDGRVDVSTLTPRTVHPYFTACLFERTGQTVKLSDRPGQPGFDFSLSKALAFGPE